MCAYVQRDGERKRYNKAGKLEYIRDSALAWKIPWTEETGRLQSMGSLRFRHD